MSSAAINANCTDDDAADIAPSNVKTGRNAKSNLVDIQDRIKQNSLPGQPEASEADNRFTEMKEESAKLAVKARAVVNGRFRQAARCAGYMLAFGNDETLIQADLTARGVKWPEENCKLPVPTILAREFIFEGEDCTALKNRVSEYARVVMHLALMKMCDPETVVQHFKGNGGLRGLYAKLDADGNVRIFDGGNGGKGKDGGKGKADEGNAPDAASKPKESDKQQGGAAQPVVPAVACKGLPVEKIVDVGGEVADALDVLDLSDIAAQAEVSFQHAEEEALDAERNLSAARAEAETAAEQAEAELSDRIADAERVAKNKAAAVEKAQRLRDLAQRLKSVPVWGEGKFDGPRPPSKIGGEWAYGGISLAVLCTMDDGTFYVIGNVTPTWDEFIALIDAQFAS